MSDRPANADRTASPDERFRLYIDESGDHVFKHLDKPSHRYLCLLGCWFRGDAYRAFHGALQTFKQKHIPHNPDEPVILHREDIINRRKSFWRLRDNVARERFDSDLLRAISKADFRVIAVVIDKMLLRECYEQPAYPYHLALGFMLQRYCGYLNHVSRRGDVLAESRGGMEDKLLKCSYARTHQHGAWKVPASAFQRALTSRKLKLKPKSANISVLQLADLLGHPVRQAILAERGMITKPLAPFALKLVATVDEKFNRHLYEGRVEGYGKVVFPKRKAP